jgi:hypothetical protein
MSDLSGMSEEELLRRLEAFEAARAFFFEMWVQNPALAMQAGPRIQALLNPMVSPGAGEPRDA